MCYLHMEKDDVESQYTSLTAKKPQFKIFCRLNENDMSTFLHLNYLSVRYFTVKWVESLNENTAECYKKFRQYTGEQKPNVLPHFSAIVDSIIIQVDKALSQDLHTLEDLDLEF